MPTSPLGQRLQDARAAKKWTAKQLALESGVPAMTIRGIEYGKTPSLPNALALARTLGLSVEELFPLSDLTPTGVQQVAQPGT